AAFTAAWISVNGTYTGCDKSGKRGMVLIHVAFLLHGSLFVLPRTTPVFHIPSVKIMQKMTPTLLFSPQMCAACNRSRNRAFWFLG
ncbi:MAG TPA: hypothetical protein VJC18_04950, partial [bacterium]|nr:hypothetical protein [bacterium]